MALSTFYILIVKFTLLLAATVTVRSSDPHNIKLEPINPPAIQCEPLTFRWKGGTPPFFVNLLQIEGLNQRHLGPTNNSSIPWGSDLPAGTILQATVSGLDSVSDQTETFTVQAGPSSSCFGLPPATVSVGVSNSAIRSTDPNPIVHRSTTASSGTSRLPAPTSTSLSLSTTPISPEPSTSASPETDRDTDTETLPPTGSENSPTPSSYEGTSVPQTINHSSDIPGTDFSSTLPPFQTPTGSDTASFSQPFQSSLPSIFNPASTATSQQGALSKSSQGGRVAGIIIGCLLAAIMAALALVLLQKRRRAKEWSRIASMTTLDTLAFTATTWSDLSPPEADKPLGANKGVTEWNADLFARQSSRKQQNERPSRSYWIPFAMPQAPFKRKARIMSLSTIPEASAETSMPSPVESDDSASTAPSLHSYPPLVPQSLSGGLEDHTIREHAYAPAALPSAQVPMNPFRARLLAAASNRTHAWGDDLRDPFR